MIKENTVKLGHTDFGNNEHGFNEPGNNEQIRPFVKTKFDCMPQF